MTEGEEADPVGGKGQCPCSVDDPSFKFQLYTDGHGYCFAGSCESPFWSTDRLAKAGWEVDPDALGQSRAYTPERRHKMSEDLAALLASCEVRDFPARKLTQATARHFDYRGRLSPSGEAQHVAVYRDEAGSPVAAKIRNPDKSFPWVGDQSAVSLYGIHLLGKSGKKVIITEGEIDCLTVSQLWANRFPVLSLANGSKGAKKDVAKVLDRLSAFDEVVLCFDQDEPGRQAALEVAKMLPLGKASIVSLPRKDANEMLQHGEAEALMNAIHKAAPYRPDGVVSAGSLVGRALGQIEWGLRMGIPFLDNLQWGWRDGELIFGGAGTGMGKSDLMMQVAAFLLTPRPAEGYPGTPCAIFNYEANPEKTLRGVAGKQQQKRFNRPGEDGLYWTQDELVEALRYLTHDCAKLFINDTQGAMGFEAFEERVRYLAHAEGVKRFFGDPMAAFAAEMEDERRGIDIMMARMKGLAEELKIGIWINSHLSHPQDGKPHEEGGRVTLRQFRGSGAIAMWPSLVFGIERDQQAEDPTDRALTILRSLKVREAGENVGLTGSFVYNVLTGMWEPTEYKMDQSGGPAEPPPVED